MPFYNESEKTSSTIILRYREHKLLCAAAEEVKNLSPSSQTIKLGKYIIFFDTKRKRVLSLMDGLTTLAPSYQMYKLLSSIIMELDAKDSMYSEEARDTLRKYGFINVDNVSIYKKEKYYLRIDSPGCVHLEIPIEIVNDKKRLAIAYLTCYGFSPEWEYTETNIENIVIHMHGQYGPYTELENGTSFIDLYFHNGRYRIYYRKNMIVNIMQASSGVNIPVEQWTEFFKSIRVWNHTVEQRARSVDLNFTI